MTTIITEVRNARSLQSDNNRMDVEINHPVHGWIPYGLNADDSDTTVDNAAILALIGTDFADYVIPTPPTELEVAAKLSAVARNTRNGLIKETDWCACSDVTMSPAMTAYRAALRDVPEQAGFPHTIIWPDKEVAP